MPSIPAEAVRLALAAYRDLLNGRPDPMVLSDETLIRLVLEAAAPAMTEHVARNLQWLLDAGWTVRLQRHEPKGADWEPFISVLAQSRTSAYSCAGSSPGEALAKVRKEAGRVKLAAGLPFGGTVRDG